MIATAGVLSEEESVGAPQFSLEEMKALVDEAAMWHRKVMAHAHGTEGIKRAITAGVASIDHGSFLDDEAIRMLKEHGTFLVADIYNDDYILGEVRKPRLSRAASWRRSARSAAPSARASRRRSSPG